MLNVGPPYGLGGLLPKWVCAPPPQPPPPPPSAPTAAVNQGDLTDALQDPPRPHSAPQPHGMGGGKGGGKNGVWGANVGLGGIYG